MAVWGQTGLRGRGPPARRQAPRRPAALKISISTIHGFKGLESDFVIIAGLEDVDIENNELMSLVFVGYSRAKMGLTILMNDYALNSLISRKN